MKPNYIVILLILVVQSVSAQEDSLINHVDVRGLKQGHWIYYGNDRPELGYPAEGKIEEGTYVDNRKEGLWIKYHIDGKTPKLKGEYHNNRPNGPYTKIWKWGIVKEKGTFERGRYKGDLVRYDSTGRVRYHAVHNDEGFAQRDTFFYYQDNNCLDSAEIWDNVEKQLYSIHYSIDSCNFLLEDTKRKRKQRKYYGCDFGTSNSKKVTPVPNIPNEYVSEADVQPTYAIDKNRLKQGEFVIIENHSGTDRSLDLRHEVEINKETLKPDGYQIIYHLNGDLFLEGDFKDYKFIRGKVYEFDQERILLKIKIYKKGKYHSEGQI